MNTEITVWFSAYNIKLGLVIAGVGDIRKLNGNGKEYNIDFKKGWKSLLFHFPNVVI